MAPPGINVDLAALDEAAGELGSEAAAIHAADVAGPFQPLDAALPGSQTAVGALWFSTRMGAAAQVLGDRVESLGDNARLTAQSYRASDGRASGRFGPMSAR